MNENEYLNIKPDYIYISPDKISQDSMLLFSSTSQIIILIVFVYKIFFGKIDFIFFLLYIIYLISQFSDKFSLLLYRMENINTLFEKLFFSPPKIIINITDNNNCKENYIFP